MSLRPGRKKKHDVTRFIVKMPASALFAGQMVKQALNEICYGLYQPHEQRLTGLGSMVIDGYEHQVVRLAMDVEITGVMKDVAVVCTMKDSVPAALGADESQWWPDKVHLTIDGTTTYWKFHLLSPQPGDPLQDPKFSQMRFIIKPDVPDEGPQPAII